MEPCGHIPVWTGERIERTNARGRHWYGAPFKAWLVEQALVPGMSMAGLAMRNQVNANQLRRWVLLHRVRGATDLLPALVTQSLLPVNVAPEPSPAGVPIEAKVDNAVAIEIEVGGAIVRVRDGARAQTLRTVLDALRGSPG